MKQPQKLWISLVAGIIWYGVGLYLFIHSVRHEMGGEQARALLAFATMFSLTGLLVMHEGWWPPQPGAWRDRINRSVLTIARRDLLGWMTLCAGWGLLLVPGYMLLTEEFANFQIALVAGLMALGGAILGAAWGYGILSLTLSVCSALMLYTMVRLIMALG